MNIFSFIKSKVSILDVVNEYATLKKAGLYWKGCCPFHHERTASFTVSPHREIYYCFGCQNGGDVIAFISKAEHCTPLEAARHIADRYNIALPESITWEQSDEYADKKRRYYDLCNLVAHWCAEQLYKSSESLAYVKEIRGINDATLKQCYMGYFPSGAQCIKQLCTYVQAHSFLATDLIDAKIVFEGKGMLYSPFEDRIIFPIKDHLGRVCGFGGRIFKAKDERAKYYNSHDHEFFNKGSLLFGFDVAKKKVQQDDAVFLVEGYTDCVAMVQAGFENTVATLGTACTLEHLKQLSRYAQRLYVIYDGDEAGQNAIMRLTQLCWQVDMELSVVVMPQKEDPASFLAKGGDLAPLIHDAADIFLFFISKVGTNFTGRRLHDRMTIVQKLLEIISAIPDPLKRDLLLQTASTRLDIPFQTLKDSMKGKSDFQTLRPGERGENQGGIKSADAREASAVRPKGDDLGTLEKKIFSAILGYGELMNQEDEEFLIISLPSPLNTLIKKLQDYKKSTAQFEFLSFFDSLLDTEKELVSRLLVEQDDTMSSATFQELFAQLQKKQWKMMVNDVKMKLSQAQHMKNADDVQKILADFQALKQKMLRKGLV